MRKRWFWIVMGVLVLLALTTAMAWAAPLNQEGTGATTDQLWLTLAPLMAIATFIERALEIFWDRWERIGVWPHRKGVPDTKDPTYISNKKLRSHLLGTLLALIAIALTNVRFFRLLGFDVLFSSPNLVLFNANIGGLFDNFTVGTLIDWAMTSTIIGWGGTELTHNVIEGLVKGRGLWKEMQEVEAGRMSILDAKFFNEYIAPELEKRGISVADLRQAFSTLCTVGIPVNEFVGAMSIGKANEFLEEYLENPKTARAAQAVKTVLEGVPPAQQAEVPGLLNLLSTDQRERFLGA